jgi:hypothetical protein
VSIRSSIPGGTYQGGWQGTSMAGPHVAGLVALLISAEPSIAGQLDYIEDVVERSAVRRTYDNYPNPMCGSDTPSSVPNNVYGWGRIDALAAYNLLRSPFTMSATPATADICAPNDASFGVTITPTLTSFPGLVALSVSGVPKGATSFFSPNPVAAPWSATLTIGNTGAGAVGSYPLAISGTVGLASASTHAQLELNNAAPAAVGGLTISRASATEVELTWDSVDRATGYQVWRGVNAPYFAAGVSCASPAPYGCDTVTATSYPHALLGNPAYNTTYLVQAVNACGVAAGNPPRAGEFGYAVTPGN